MSKRTRTIKPKQPMNIVARVERGVGGSGCTLGNWTYPAASGSGWIGPRLWARVGCALVGLGGPTRFLTLPASPRCGTILTAFLRPPRPALWLPAGCDGGPARFPRRPDAPGALWWPS